MQRALAPGSPPRLSSRQGQLDAPVTCAKQRAALRLACVRLVSVRWLEVQAGCLQKDS